LKIAATRKWPEAVGQGRPTALLTLPPENPIGSPKNGPIFICWKFKKLSYVNWNKKDSKGNEANIP